MCARGPSITVRLADPTVATSWRSWTTDTNRDTRERESPRRPPTSDPTARRDSTDRRSGEATLSSVFRFHHPACRRCLPLLCPFTCRSIFTIQTKTATFSKRFLAVAALSLLCAPMGLMGNRESDRLRGRAAGPRAQQAEQRTDHADDGRRRTAITRASIVSSALSIASSHRSLHALTIVRAFGHLLFLSFASNFSYKFAIFF